MSMSYPPNPPPMRRPRPHVVNHKSELLDNVENDRAVSLLGKKCSTLSTAVVQVFLARNNRWNKKGVGVCCLVKDNPKRSYFIRVFNLATEHMIFEQELYHDFKYSTPRPYFHTFDTNDCRAALNFASISEARHFQETIEEKIRHRQEKKQAKSQERPPPPATPRPPAPVPVSNHGSNIPRPSNHSTLQIPATSIQGGAMQEESKKDKKSKKKGKKGKLTKADISTPQDFKHVGHVGWDPNTGFDMNEVDPALKSLFAQAGISDSQLKDKETAQFIYDFIEKRGGVDAVKKSQTQGPPPPPPNRGSAPPPPPSRGRGGPPPPPPSRSGGGPPPPPPSRGSHPPPPPPTSRGAPPPPPISSGRQRGPPPPPPSMPPPAPSSYSSGPPPPPAPAPPPPPPAPVAPPPPPISGGDGRGMLLDQIRGGASLKSVDDRQLAESPAPSGRGALLDQIRQGKQLRSVSQDDSRGPAAEEEEDASLAGALARALMQREKAIHDSDSDSDGEFNDDDDDDWDD